MELYPQGAIPLDSADWRWQGRPHIRNRKPVDLNEAISRSVKQGGYWEKCTFTVPDKVSEERVQLLGHKYMNKFGAFLESEGLTVRQMMAPVIDSRPLPVEPDRRRYIIFAFVSRRSFEPVFSVPDQYVPEMLKAGLRLLE